MLNVGAAPASVLDGQAFIAREQGSGTRAVMVAFLAERHLEPRITMEISSNETIKRAVMAGLGISLLSLHTLGLELRSGLLRPLDIEGTPLMRTWHIVHLRSRVPSPSAEAFRCFIIERGEAHLLAHDEPLLRPGREKAGQS